MRLVLVSAAIFSLGILAGPQNFIIPHTSILCPMNLFGEATCPTQEPLVVFQHLAGFSNIFLVTLNAYFYQTFLIVMLISLMVLFCVSIKILSPPQILPIKEKWKSKVNNSLAKLFDYVLIQLESGILEPKISVPTSS